MKILVASDIHGSLTYTHKVMEAYQRENAERLLLLGDLLYHGPRNPLPDGYDPLMVSQLLNSHAGLIWAVRGNCDSEVDQMVLDFEMMADYMPLCVNGMNIIASHGHIYNPENLPKQQGKIFFLFGHIHLPVAEKTAFGYAGNPGSAALAKNGIPSYGLLDNQQWVIKDFENRIIEKIEIDIR